MDKNASTEETIAASEDTTSDMGRRLPRARMLSILSISFTACLLLVAIALLSYSCAYISKPGPSTQDNHFSTIVLSLCLLFEVLQVLLILTHLSGYAQRRFLRWTRWLYWVLVTLTSFISFVAYAVSRKGDAAATQFLSFLVGAGALTLLVFSDRKASHRSVSGPRKALALRISRYFNRFLKTIHCCFCILFVAGAIISSMQHRYKNPGTLYDVPFKDGTTRQLNVHCTSVKPNGTVLPTIWFECTPAHGITDFLGVQHFLEVHHGRNSCSYDHPSFGWSQPALKGYTNSTLYWTNLLKVLDRDREPNIIAGMGSGGEDALSHALEMPDTTKGVVIMDTSPDGIEWMDEQRKQNWTEQQMLDFRQTDLQTRIASTQLILSLGFGWGLIPVFIPSNVTTYFDSTLYPAHRAQALKDTMVRPPSFPFDLLSPSLTTPQWAHQYYALLSFADQRNLSSFLTTTVLPPTTAVYALMTRDPNPDDAASNAFQRDRKRDMVASIAGGEDKIKASAECAEDGCALDFPVVKAEWTADALVRLGV
ncbi:MAG: hypothetical protein M1833_004601 [Piccolia ochrophora]|nr:MAG: hypothetical protein M1833_004601 [Piccolia ochrophora]